MKYLFTLALIVVVYHVSKAHGIPPYLHFTNVLQVWAAPLSVVAFGAVSSLYCWIKDEVGTH